MGSRRTDIRTRKLEAFTVLTDCHYGQPQNKHHPKGYVKWSVLTDCHYGQPQNNAADGRIRTSCGLNRLPLWAAAEPSVTQLPSGRLGLNRLPLWAAAEPSGQNSLERGISVLTDCHYGQPQNFWLSIFDLGEWSLNRLPLWAAAELVIDLRSRGMEGLNRLPLWAAAEREEFSLLYVPESLNRLPLWAAAELAAKLKVAFVRNSLNRLPLWAAAEQTLLKGEYHGKES